MTIIKSTLLGASLLAAAAARPTHSRPKRSLPEPEASALKARTTLAEHHIHTKWCKHADPNENPDRRRRTDAHLAKRHRHRLRTRRGVESEPQLSIPVAFTVLHDGDTGKVTAQQISEQVAVLNEGFGGRTDAAGTDARIQFTLGPVRYVDNSNYYNNCAEPSVETEYKQTYSVDPTRHLNVFTCAGGGYLGWAVFPDWYAEESYEHSIVLAAGSLPGGDIETYNLGDTATHEVGHLYGLYHTFEGGCSGGDQIADTPAEADAGDGCYIIDSCTNDDSALAALGITDTRDPLWNFMDYSTDICMTRFSPQQVARMRDALKQYKPQLIANTQVTPCEGTDCTTAPPPPPTTTTTRPPAPSTSPVPPGECVDKNNADGTPWHDVDGSEYNCEWYVGDNVCNSMGDDFANDGITANMACCGCGGGNVATTEPTAGPSTTDGPSPTLTTEPTAGPSTTDGPSPTLTTDGPSSECLDSSSWIFITYNGATKTCSWVANKPGNRCGKVGTEGVVASEACPVACGACDSSTDGPTGECADKPAPDGGEWHDSDGPEFDCAYYADDASACASYGDDFEWGGMTANQACCACGGGFTNPVTDSSIKTTHTTTTTKATTTTTTTTTSTTSTTTTTSTATTTVDPAEKFDRLLAYLVSVTDPAEKERLSFVLAGVWEHRAIVMNPVALAEKLVELGLDASSVDDSVALLLAAI